MTTASGARNRANQTVVTLVHESSAGPQMSLDARVLLPQPEERSLVAEDRTCACDAVC